MVFIVREYACVGRCVAICGAKRPRERRWSGFNGIPLNAAKVIRLNVQCFGAFWVATVQLAVNAYIAPDGAMAHEIL